MDLSLAALAVSLASLVCVGVLIWRLQSGMSGLRDRIDNRPQHKVVRFVDPADASGVDFEAPQPLGVAPHDHVWGPQPFEDDGFSRSYRCQVPRCGRIHTQMTR